MPDIQIVTFRLDKNLYGIDIMDTEGIVDRVKPTEIPNSPRYVKGICNIRGEIIPIVSLHKKFYISENNIEEMSQADRLLSGYMLLRFDNMKIAIIIDKVARVLSISEDKIQKPTEVISGVGATHYSGIINQDDGYLVILDIRKIFNLEELELLKNIKTNNT